MSKVVEIVTRRIMEALKNGVPPWKKPWTGSSPFPYNVHTGRNYSGINALALSSWVCDYEEPAWGTKNQIHQLGGELKPNQDYMPAMFVGEAKDSNGLYSGKKFARFYRVYNIAQCTGIKIARDMADRDNEKDTTAEGVIEAMPNPPRIEHGHRGCSYVPMSDLVRMPDINKFDNAEHYYRAKFHELGHSTGHVSRLDRDMKALLADKHSYSEEELVAELTASYVCAYVGMTSEEESSASYCDVWYKRLDEDRSILVRASRKAFKAFNYIIGESTEPKKNLNQ